MMPENMLTGVTIHGITSLPLLIAAFYYAVRILQNFRQHPEISMSMFFLNDRAVHAFYVVAGVAMVHSVTALVSAYGLTSGIPALDVVSKLGNTIAFLGMAYFFRAIAHVTRKPAKTAL